MTQREKFFETVGILVEAYMNGTLMHGDCAACAVGNIIAAKLRCKVVKKTSVDGELFCSWQRDEARITPLWGLIFITDIFGKQQYNPKAYYGHARLQIKVTGYSWQQLALIESAFERAAHISLSEDEAMFTGLMSVVDTLSTIHGIDLEERESAKLLFNKASV